MGKSTVTSSTTINATCPSPLPSEPVRHAPAVAAVLPEREAPTEDRASDRDRPAPCRGRSSEERGADDVYVMKQDVEVDESDRKSTRLNSSHGYISYSVF